MTIAQEEIFGPVASVITFDGIDEAIKIANDSSFGLAAGRFYWKHCIETPGPGVVYQHTEL